MKQYIKPASEIIEITGPQILNASSIWVGGNNEAVNGIDQLSGKQRGDWGELWEKK